MHRKKNRPQKKSSKSLGLIFPVGGFITNKYNIDTYLQTNMKPHVRCYEAVKLLMREDIMESFLESFIQKDVSSSSMVRAYSVPLMTAWRHMVIILKEP